MADNKTGINPPLNLRESFDLQTNTVENPTTPTKKIELPSLPEQSEKLGESSSAESLNVNETSGSVEQLDSRGIIATSQSRRLQEERYRAIENALADGLENIYMAMDAPTQQKFKIEGEAASRTINELFNQGKATARKIIDIIRRWLSLAPGLNKFFLEQEAKIKTDKIIKLGIRE